MSLVAINWKPGRRELRQFGLVMLIGFGLIGLALQFLLHRPTGALVCWAVAAVAGVLGLTGTRAALALYYPWMAIAFVIGSIVSRIVITAIYYLVVTPIALIMRLTGRDRLGLRRGQSPSYWHDSSPAPTDKTRYERQF